MAEKKEIKIPELGESINKATVSSILVEVNQAIKKDDSLIELESDKASLEIPAPFDGILKAIHVKVGDKVEVGQTIAILQTSKKSTLNNDITSNNNHKIKEDIPSEPKPLPPTPDNIPKVNPASVPLPSIEIESINSPATNTLVPAAPSVRRLAREIGVDIHKVTGTEKSGRISIADVKNHAKSLINALTSKSPNISHLNVDLPDFSLFGHIRKEKMQPIRYTIANKMSTSWQQIPHVTQFDESNILQLEHYRKNRNKQLEKVGIKITLTSILLKVTGILLKKYPIFASSVDFKNKEIIFKDYIHMGVAVDTPQGLIVPVIQDVDKKNIKDISIELNDVAQRARNKKIKPEELKGSVLSLTNLGSLGTTYFTPIINWPECAVLGIGRAKQHLILRNREPQEELLLPMSLSYDHRIIDGADAARFLRELAQGLEEPMDLFL